MFQAQRALGGRGHEPTRRSVSILPWPPPYYAPVRHWNAADALQGAFATRRSGTVSIRSTIERRSRLWSQSRVAAPTDNRPSNVIRDDLPVTISDALSIEENSS